MSHIKIIILLLFAQFSFQHSVAQDTKATVVVNTLDEQKGQITSRVFRYKEYASGRVIFKDNSSADAKFNFNQLAGKMLFINPKGDTMELANPETFKLIIVGIDTFYFFENKYLEKITHYPTINLAKNQSVKFIGKEKKGAYGTYSGVSASNSNTTFTNDDQITKNIAVDENNVYSYNNTYYLSDKFNNFSVANKKNFYKAFFVHEKEIKIFADAQAINFNKVEDLQKLVQYAHSLD
jgi:hypothetical protein